MHFILDNHLVFREDHPMPRVLRVQYPGAIYHLMSRGDRRGKIFLDDVDRQDFLKTLAETCQKTPFGSPKYRSFFTEKGASRMVLG